MAPGGGISSIAPRLSEVWAPPATSTRPVHFSTPLERGSRFALTLTTDMSGNHGFTDSATCRHPRTPTESAPHRRSADSHPVVQQLTLAADQFIVERQTVAGEASLSSGTEQAKTVIAGYHWFNDWGRDTMIALRGLTLATGRPEDAANILRNFARYIQDGLLPNNFPDRSGVIPGYNTADATLWYVIALYSYVKSHRRQRARGRVAARSRGHRRLAHSRNSLPYWRRSERRAVARRRARSTVDLDGCQGRRSRGNAPHRQAGRDQRALVQHIADPRGVSLDPRRRRGH